MYIGWTWNECLTVNWKLPFSTGISPSKHSSIQVESLPTLGNCASWVVVASVVCLTNFSPWKYRSQVLALRMSRLLWFWHNCLTWTNTFLCCAEHAGSVSAALFFALPMAAAIDAPINRANGLIEFVKCVVSTQREKKGNASSSSQTCKSGAAYSSSPHKARAGVMTRHVISYRAASSR